MSPWEGARGGTGNNFSPKENNMFDIRKIAIDLTADMPVRDVDGEVVKGDDGKELSITLYGPGSKEFVRARIELQAELMAAMAEAQADTKTPAKGKGKSKKEKTVDVEEVEEVDTESSPRRTAEFLAKITKSFNGFDYPGGPKAMYMDATLGHIAEDADKFAGKRGNFKPKSAAGSSSTSGTSPG